METRVLECDADLVGELRQQPQVVLLEHPDSTVAQLALGRGQDADDLVVPSNGHSHEAIAIGKDAVGTGLPGDGFAALDQLVGDLAVQEVRADVAERPIDLEVATLAEEQRRAAGIRQRDHAKEHFIG